MSVSNTLLLSDAPVLVTGAAGFIGYHLCQRLLARGIAVIGLDNLNHYYDPRLKQARLQRLLANPRFKLERLDLADRQGIARLFAEQPFAQVVHLGAQAGVRHSIDQPYDYLDANLAGTLNILEACRHRPGLPLIYASSSSVYGANRKTPFAVDDPTERPVSLYAATKKANELMCQSYAHLYGIPCTGLRFFTVYGPWGRPDMAYFKFADAICEGRSIDIYNHGNMQRDFTYVDDVVAAIERLLELPPPEARDGGAAHRIYNLGNDRPESLLDMVSLLEQCLGRRANKRLLPMQPGDVQATWADIEKTRRELGWAPQTRLADGLAAFTNWYLQWRLEREGIQADGASSRST